MGTQMIDNENRIVQLESQLKELMEEKDRITGLYNDLKNRYEPEPEDIDRIKALLASNIESEKIIEAMQEATFAYYEAHPDEDPDWDDE